MVCECYDVCAATAALILVLQLIWTSVNPLQSLEIGSAIGCPIIQGHHLSMLAEWSARQRRVTHLTGHLVV